MKNSKKTTQDVVKKPKPKKKKKLKESPFSEGHYVRMMGGIHNAGI